MVSELKPAADNPAVAEGIRRALERGYSASDPARPLGSLLMFSGGLDSTALLANLLTATRHRLHVHRIEIANFENRHPMENNAAKRIIDYCQTHYRPFTYSESKQEFHLGIGGGMDMTLAMFMAGRVYNAMGGGIDVVWTGHIDPAEWEVVEGAAVLHANFINKLRVPEWLRPLRRMSKKDIYESIPRELAECCWSCRAPVIEGKHYSPCGQCYTCTTIVKAGGDVMAQGGGKKHRILKHSQPPLKNQGIVFREE